MGINDKNISDKKWGAVLDLDDVLFNTSDYESKVLISAINAMLYAGFPAEKNECYEQLMKIRKELGSNNPNHFNKLCEHYGLKPAPQRIIQAGVAAYHTEREKLLVPQEETIYFLENLVKLGIKPCIVTAGKEDKQWFKIHRLGIAGYFRSNNDYNTNNHNYNVYIWRNNKNSLEGKRILIKKAIRKMNIDPKISFVVEDSPSGIVAAKKAGIKFAFKVMQGKHMYTPYEAVVQDKSLLQDKYKHDVEVNSLSEIIPFLEEYIKNRDFVIR
jgi:FMN phosphatase YigB (HAD superfamily)